MRMCRAAATATLVVGCVLMALLGTCTAGRSLSAIKCANHRQPGKWCRPECVNLLNFEPWRRELGYWFGEYTFLGGDGDPFETERWPYPYDHYFGFIRMEIVGNKLHQRNVFIYPPATAAACAASNNSVLGSGTCGVNGNEKVFRADQEAVDCRGNLAGPYFSGGQRSDTATTLIDDSTILYQVKLPEPQYYLDIGFPAFAPFGGRLIQNQMTTVLPHGVRVRTAQGFDAFAPQGELPDSASFYREYRLDNFTEWKAKLDEVRAMANILPDDFCAFDGSNAPVDEPDCFAHFRLDNEPLAEGVDMHSS